jgi:tRNA pseudouridine55 synthase
MAAPEPGIHLVHKPAGATSFSLVQGFLAEARAGGRSLRVCHGGALDPFAEGLLPILVGRATRLFEQLHPIPKEYEAELAWGAETDNGDPLGRVVARGDASHLEPLALEEALRPFLGWREQVPPATSNKRVGGERAYVLAHRGEEVILPAVRVYLHNARWLWHDLPRASGLRLVVRGGYYVRSLARELGRALGCRAHLLRLRRTAIGPWGDPGGGKRIPIRGAGLLPWCPFRAVDPPELLALRAGLPIPRGEVRPPQWLLPQGFPAPDGPIRAFRGDELVALVRERDGTLWQETALGGL